MLCKRLLPVIVLFFLAGFAPAQSPPRFGELFDKGELLRQEGDLEGALGAFQEARKTAEGTDKAKVDLQTGGIRVDLARRQANKKEPHLQQAINDLQSAVENSEGSFKAKAQNNLATALLAAGQPDKAIEVLDDCDWNSIDRSHHFVLQYNLGKANALKGDEVKALSWYTRSLENNPQFDEAAVQAVQAVAKADSAAIIGPAFEFGQLLLAKQRTSLARQLSLDVLRRSDELGPDSEQLLAILLAAYAQQLATPQALSAEESFGPRDLVERELPALRDAIGKGSDKAVTAEIELACVGELPMQVLSHGQLPVEVFPWYSLRGGKPVREAFSQLLQRAGDWYAGMHAPKLEPTNAKEAVARYLLAWAFDHNDAAAAENAAGALARFSDQIDREGQLVGRFVDALFDEKAGLVAKPNKTPSDWERLTRIHTVLGTMFFERNLIKPKEAGDYRNAQVQWEQALGEAAEVRKSIKDYRVPLLHARLAQLYLQTEKYSLSFDQWLDAAEDYLARDEATAAAQMVGSAKRLRFELSNQQSERLAKLEKAVQ